MHRFLYLASIVAGGTGAYYIIQGPTITQQTAGLIILLIAAVLLSGAAVVQAVAALATPGEKTLSPEELHEKQVRELAASWTAPAADPASPQP